MYVCIRALRNLAVRRASSSAERRRGGCRICEVMEFDIRYNLFVPRIVSMHGRDGIGGIINCSMKDLVRYVCNETI